jgi:polyhydroxybutyrate depolymerase
VDDLAFFDALLETLSGERRIDPARVFATGISNGGILSHFLAAATSHVATPIAAYPNISRNQANDEGFAVVSTETYAGRALRTRGMKPSWIV